MPRFKSFMVAAALLPAVGSLGVGGIAHGAAVADTALTAPATASNSAAPMIRLAQTPAEIEKKKKEQQQHPAPPQARPPAPPPQAHPQAPAAPPPQQRPVQAPPPAPPPHPVQAPPPPPPPHPVAPAQAPVAPQIQRPVQAPPPAPPAAPAQTQQQFQRPVQGPPPGQPPRVPPPNAPAQNAPQHLPPQNAPAQVAPQNTPAQVAPLQGQNPPRHTGPLAPPPALPAPAAQTQPLRPIGGGAAAIAPHTAGGQPVLRVDALHAERHETHEGNRTVIREPDRVIVRENDGRISIRHSETDRFRFNARDVHVETRGGNNVTTAVLPNGDRVVTVLAPDGRLLRRSRVFADGREVIIIDDRGPPVADVYVRLAPPIIRIPRERYIVDAEGAPPAMIYDTLMEPPVDQLERPYSLDEIRYSPELRDRMPRVDIDTITFETGSWEIGPEQVDRLAVIAEAVNRAIAANPREVFMIEGHTDAVGNDVDNLSLSDRRAETVALVLSDKFQVPPENLVTQGYGEQFLKIPTDGPERRNRRVTIRRITPLLAGNGG